MKRRSVVCCLAGLCVALLWPMVVAVAAGAVDDGTPNLGTAAIQQQDARWFVEGRIFDTNEDQQWYGNSTLSIGFAAPVNEETEFDLMVSALNNAGEDPIAGAIRESKRVVLAPYVKRCFSKDGNSTISLTIGADVALNQAKGVVGVSEAYQNDFTPAAKLQLQWGSAGQVQWQAAAQVAFWNTWCATNIGGAIPGFGTVVALGGGVSVPMGNKLTLVGDVMGIVGGKNVINSVTNDVDTQLIWSAGGNWLFGGPFTTSLKVFATNAMGPTPATSIIGAPDNSVGFGVALLREF